VGSCLAALVAVTLAGGCAASGTRGSDDPPARVAAVPDDGSSTRVDVGGYRLAVRCRGHGRPNVVLEAGFGLSSARWRWTQRLVGRHFHVCAYDRSGVGRSDEKPAASNRSIAEELHILLVRIGLQPPYVLAGHSAGGGYIADYARAYPDEVLGLVLVDAVSAEPLPDELADAPVIVLEAGRNRDPGWTAVQSANARLSSNSVYAVALRSGHHIQASQPDVVTAAIRAVARGARTGDPLPRCSKLFAGLEVECPARPARTR
jgi:pimeloyl-ACP methyl ester carboxylesterase